MQKWSLEKIKDISYDFGDQDTSPGVPTPSAQSLNHRTDVFFGSSWINNWAPLVARMVKKIHLQCGRPGFNPWVEKIPWRRAWQPTPVSCLENPHGQRNLVGHGQRSQWGCKELDMTEWLSTAQINKYSLRELHQAVLLKLGLLLFLWLALDFSCFNCHSS